MQYLCAIFFLGLMVSLLVVKGVIMAQEHTAEEMERMEREKLGGGGEG